MRAIFINLTSAIVYVLTHLLLYGLCRGIGRVRLYFDFIRDVFEQSNYIDTCFHCTPYLFRNENELL